MNDGECSLGLPEQNFLAQMHHSHSEGGEGFADGGAAEDGGDDPGVPIVAAGGEHVLHPDQVRAAGGGDLETGHAVLDEFVKRMRKNLVKTLKALPGPKKD